MKAVEFNSYISEGLIKIPLDYSLYNNRKVKIIMLFPEEERNYDKEELLSAFENARKLNVFSNKKGLPFRKDLL